MRVQRVWLGLVAVVAGAFAGAAPAEHGDLVEDVKLRLLDGGTASLVERSSIATVAVFFRPGQDRSVDALRAVGECQASFAAKPVRFVGVVSADAPAPDVHAALASAGARLPVLLDEGDAVYARLGVRTHPAIVILDRSRRVAAFETYRQVGLCDVIRARVRRLLGDISEAELASAIAPAQSQLPGEAPTDVAARHVKLARKLLLAKAYAQAHENARKALALVPSAAAWALEGEIFAAEGRCADAIRAFDAALALAPGDPAATAGRSGCAP